ncbi:MAG: hypothetical protein Kow00117_09520 [Phototrophicales bacterium]|nr:MAG: hypothetical protein CUN56_10275 [Phototrophicales bacterium]RMG71418.1 MAG: hypothetical protein D6711_15420 [Chloroflexota bacterium]
MPESYLTQFMNVAQGVTHAERGLAVDNHANIIKANNIDPSTIDSEEFQTFAMPNLRQAMTLGEPIITNNVITDLSQAPTTNTNFTNLRIAVALPIPGHGAIYLDRRVRDGVITKQTIDKLMQLAQFVEENQFQIKNEDELFQLYQELT